jgi:flagellar motility protein MotE (MotC chaperone)
LTLDALSAELKAAATAGHARAREEQARIDEDKKKLKDMAAQIELARHELRAETLALEQLTQSESPGTGGPRGRRAVLGRLAKTIQGMKPAQAASLLERLEPGLAVELFRQMRPGDAAPIVEQLKPDLAAHFFTALAARAPTNKELSP